jgi:autotransporter-associated beta strand protein
VGKFLTVDAVGGASLIVAGTITGSGTILKGGNPVTDAAQLPANNSVKTPVSGFGSPAIPPIYNGTGTMTLPGDNSGFTGNLVINYGTVIPTTATSLGAATASVLVNGPINYQSLDSNQANRQTSGNQGGGTLQFQGGVTFSGGPPITLQNGGTINNAANNNAYNGNILLVNGGNFTAASGTTFTLNGGLNDSGTASTITKSGAGTVTFAAPAVSLVNGTTVAVTAGTLNSNNATAIGGLATLNVSAGATFSAGANQTVGTLVGGGTANLNSNVLTIGASNNLLGTFNGAISGAGSITKAGTGTLTLNGASSYSGGTLLNTGTLTVPNSQGLGTGTVTLAGGTLSLGALSAGTPLVSGFGGNGTGWQLNAAGGNPAGVPSISGDVLTLTTAVNNEASSAYNATKVTLPTGGFQAKYTWTKTAGGTNPADGMTFIIHNAAVTALGGGGGGLGYSGITPSVGVALSVYGGNPQGAAGRGVNVFTGGNSNNSTYVSNAPLNDTTDNTPINITLTYLNGVLTINHIQGANSFTTTFNVDIPTASGANTNNGQAFVGFTGGTGGLNVQQNISNFTFSPLTSVGSVTYTNAVATAANATATISAVNSTTNMGALTLQSASTLNVVSDPLANPNTAYTLNFGATTLAGNATLNVANNGTGGGTVTFGALNDGGAARTFTKSGAGTLTLSAPATTITNGTQVNLTAGTLNANAVNSVGPANVNQSAGTTFNIGASQAIGALNGTGTTNLNGNTLTIGANNNLNSTYGGVIADGTGSGSVIKQGTGTLLLNGVNTYTGPTTLANGTLGGNGTIAGSVTVNAGTLSPGTSPGKLTTGAVTFTGQFGGIFLAELNGTGQGTTYDWLSSTGAVSLGNNVALLSTALGYAPAAADSLTIISGTSLTGTFANAPNGQPLLIGSFNGQMYAANVNYTATSVVLSGFQPVPEPVHVLLLCGGVAGGLGLWRRNRNVARSGS